MLILHQIITYVFDVIFQQEYKKLIMAIDDKIRDEKLQCNINSEAGKVSIIIR